MSTLFSRADGRWRAVLVVGAVVALIAAGAFIAIPAAAGVAPAATAKWGNCSGVEFFPEWSSDVYQTDSSSGLRYGASNFFCALHLPHGATVTTVKFHVRDLSPTANVQECFVARIKLDPPTGVRQVLAGPLATSGSPGYQTLKDSSIQNATVDDRLYAYHAECAVGGNTTSVGIFGASVRHVP